MKYFVGEKEFETEEKALSVRELLEQADYPPAAHYVLAKSGREFRDLDESVPIKDGAMFEAKPRDKAPVNGEVCYKVNGEPQRTTAAELSYEDLLKNAGTPAGIALDHIAMHELVDDRTGTRYRPGSVVPIKPGDEFLAIYRGHTPVA